MHDAFKNVCSRGPGTEHTLSDEKDVRATAVVHGDACFEACVYFGGRSVREPASVTCDDEKGTYSMCSTCSHGNLHQSLVTMKRGPTVCIPRVFHVLTQKLASVTCDDEKGTYCMYSTFPHGNLHLSLVTMRRPTVCIPRAHTGTCISHL